MQKFGEADFEFKSQASHLNALNKAEVQLIDKEVKKIVDERYKIAKDLLTKNRDMLEYISKTLLDEETIDEKRFVELMEKVESERG